MTILKAAVIQYPSAFGIPQKNTAAAEKYISQAADTGAGLVIFPEQFFTGWGLGMENFQSDAYGLIPSFIIRAAREYSIAIAGNYIRKSPGIKPFNTAIIADESGVIAEYSKIHLFSPSSENENISAGDKPCIFDCRGIKTGFSICYDLRFPELFTYYGMNDCDLIINQSAWLGVRLPHYRALIQARAIENHLWVIGSNTIGTTPEGEYTGGSLAVSPAGIITADGGDQQKIIYAEIDSDLVKEERKKIPSLSDRRADLYIEW